MLICGTPHRSPKRAPNNGKEANIIKIISSGEPPVAIKAISKDFASRLLYDPVLRLVEKLLLAVKKQL